MPVLLNNSSASMLNVTHATNPFPVGEIPGINDEEGAFLYLSICWKIIFVTALFSGFLGNLFITVNVFGDSQMRNTNYFFVLNLVLVDLFVILGVLVVKEVALAVQSQSPFLICFPTVWNFVVNYTASNYILLFLCYEKFVLIRLPFMKQKLLSMRVKVVFTCSVYLMTVLVGVLKIHTMESGHETDPDRGTHQDEDVDLDQDNPNSRWCPFAFPIIKEWISDLIDMLSFFAVPLLFQLIMYTYIFFRAQEVSGVVQRGNADGTQVSGAAPNRNRRQRPQLRVAKTCLVATVVRFSLWSPYVVHLVRLSLKQAFGMSKPGERSEYELIADKFFPDLTIIASCTNPVVFIAMSPPLQRRLKSFLVCMKNYCCCGIIIKKLCCPSGEETQIQKNDVIDHNRLLNGESTDGAGKSEVKKRNVQDKTKFKALGIPMQPKKFSISQTQFTEVIESVNSQESCNKLDLHQNVIMESAA